MSFTVYYLSHCCLACLQGWDLSRCSRFLVTRVTLCPLLNIEKSAVRNYKDAFTFCVCGGTHQSKVVKELTSSVAALLIQSACKIKRVSNACWNIYTVMWLVLFCKDFLHPGEAGSGKIWSKYFIGDFRTTLDWLRLWQSCNTPEGRCFRSNFWENW